MTLSSGLAFQVWIEKYYGLGPGRRDRASDTGSGIATSKLESLSQKLGMQVSVTGGLSHGASAAASVARGLWPEAGGRAPATRLTGSQCRLQCGLDC